MNHEPKPSLKLKIAKNKVNTTFESKNIPRVKSSVNTKSRNYAKTRMGETGTSDQRINYESLTKQRSMAGMSRMPSNFR